MIKTARPKAMNSVVVRPQLRSRALLALARYKASGLLLAGDRLHAQIVEYNAIKLEVEES